MAFLMRMARLIFFFDNEAIFDINATYGVAPYTKSGKSSKRLKYNEVVKQEVILQ